MRLLGLYVEIGVRTVPFTQMGADLAFHLERFLNGRQYRYTA
jgi:hypothetical protein